MSLTRTLIQQAGPIIQANLMTEILEAEARRGCDPTISAIPLPLEPPYQPIHASRSADTPESDIAPLKYAPTPPDALQRYRIWISPEEELDYRRMERFLKQLVTIGDRAGLEISGNAERGHIVLLCTANDSPVVEAAFRGEFIHHQLEPIKEEPLCFLSQEAWHTARLYDLWPTPPYSHLLTRVTELRYSALESLLASLAVLPPPAIGIYQVLFQPVSPLHNWHRNVEILQDMEFGSKLMTSAGVMQRFGQQLPSGDLRNMSSELESKAHTDKPFFAVAMRLAVAGENARNASTLQALSAFTSLFQHGGRPLNRLSEVHYGTAVGDVRIDQMFRLGLTYRHGFLLNSLELTGPCHFPSAAAIQDRNIAIDVLTTLPVRTGAIAVGTHIGFSVQGHNELPVVVPEDLETRSTHLIGAPGMGKSTLMENMVLQDVERGRAVIVIDPHGPLVERLLSLIPSDHVDRTIYFSPSMEGHIPLWNPLKRDPRQDAGRIADDMVAAIKSFMDGWGDRLGHLLRKTFSALLEMPDATLYEATEILLRHSKLGKRLRAQICDTVQNEHTRRFWKDEFTHYRSDALTPPQHKLGTLFDEESLRYMLSQPDSRISINQVISEKKVLLINMSGVGSDTRNILSSFLLALVRMAVLGRNPSKITNDRIAVYCDEAHRFLTDSMEDLFNEGRKYNVKFHVAHQKMSQFTPKRADALGSAGTTTCFCVDSPDARHMAGRYLGKITPQDLMDLEKYEAIARIGQDIVRVQMSPPPPQSLPGTAKRIVEQSLAAYYKPVQEVKEIIRQRRSRQMGHTFSRHLPSVSSYGGEEEFVYEEF